MSTGLFCPRGRIRRQHIVHILLFTSASDWVSLVRRLVSQHEHGVLPNSRLNCCSRIGFVAKPLVCFQYSYTPVCCCAGPRGLKAEPMGGKAKKKRARSASSAPTPSKTEPNPWTAGSVLSPSKWNDNPATPEKAGGEPKPKKQLTLASKFKWGGLMSGQWRVSPQPPKSGSTKPSPTKSKWTTTPETSKDGVLKGVVGTHLSGHPTLAGRKWRLFTTDPEMRSHANYRAVTRDNVRFHVTIAACDTHLPCCVKAANTI